MRRWDTRILTEAALTLALAVVFNYVTTVWQMPQGGAVSLEMLPIIVLAMRRGPKVGLVAGAVYGVLDLIKEPFVVHPVQFILDYPLAYAFVGLAGVGSAAWRKAYARGAYGVASAVTVASVTLAAVLRYASHVVSGVVFFSQFAEGKPVWVYSLVYNTYVPVAAAICAVAAVVVMPLLERVYPSQRSG